MIPESIGSYPFELSTELQMIIFVGSKVIEEMGFIGSLKGLILCIVERSS